jgi:hypothetical protein
VLLKSFEFIKKQNASYSSSHTSALSKKDHNIFVVGTFAYPRGDPSSSLNRSGDDAVDDVGRGERGEGTYGLRSRVLRAFESPPVIMGDLDALTRRRIVRTVARRFIFERMRVSGSSGDVSTRSSSTSIEGNEDYRGKLDISRRITVVIAAYRS